MISCNIVLKIWYDMTSWYTKVDIVMMKYDITWFGMIRYDVIQYNMSCIYIYKLSSDLIWYQMQYYMIWCTIWYDTISNIVKGMIQDTIQDI